MGGKRQQRQKNKTNAGVKHQGVAVWRTREQQWGAPGSSSVEDQRAAVGRTREQQGLLASAFLNFYLIYLPFDIRGNRG